MLPHIRNARASCRADSVLTTSDKTLVKAFVVTDQFNIAARWNCRPTTIPTWRQFIILQLVSECSITNIICVSMRI